MRKAGEDERVERAKFLLRDAVRLQLRSDVPVGTFLSGGIDSSGITALAAQMMPSLDTFGVAFRDHYFDESEYARLVAAHCRTRHHEQTVDTSDVLAHLDTLATYMDEPNSDPALLPSYLICKFAREHVKVVLAGNGGDEVFGGYARHTEAMTAGGLGGSCAPCMSGCSRPRAVALRSDGMIVRAGGG
jgi:asparagine synthase (glutamine-hydrolysing)